MPMWVWEMMHRDKKPWWVDCNAKWLQRDKKLHHKMNTKRHDVTFQNKCKKTRRHIAMWMQEMKCRDNVTWWVDYNTKWMQRDKKTHYKMNTKRQEEK